MFSFSRSAVYKSWTMWPELDGVCALKAPVVLRRGRHSDVQQGEQSLEGEGGKGGGQHFWTWKSK